MRHSKLTDIQKIKCLLVLKDHTENTVSLKLIKASTYKPNGNPTPGDKTIGLESAIRFYEIEDADNTEEVQ